MPRSDREGVIQTDAKHFQSALCALAEFTSNTAPRPAAPVRPAAVEHPSAAEAERRTAELLAKLFPAGAGENAPPAEPPAAPVAPPARPPARPDTWSNSDDLFGSPAWDHEDAAGVSDYMPAAFALPEAEASVVAPEPSPLLPTESTLTPAQASANDVFSNFQW